ncbi:hydroxysteroid 11-beta-dehydrogenase 1-like protein [Antedon mediterranea]|uniref:hydroxysteroid 11-beta-dehydrogenase 1-like protein n=1 Tax=Antedon mediterranea TaxID=105859 RepID=UPI003AF5EC70
MAFLTKNVLYVLCLMVAVAYFMYDGFDEESVKGKRVVITGASTGIGEQIAYHYARFGAKIIVTARREAVLQKVVAKCKELGAEEAFYLPLDMANMNHTKQLIQEAKNMFGGLDYLILNHITSNYLTTWKGDMERLNDVININFNAYVSLATEALPMLDASNGSIAVVSSFAGKVGIPYSASYSASKFALGGFFGALRQELIFKEQDVSITLCIIGSINTTNAVEFSKDVLNTEFLFKTSASDTALAIIKGTVTRQREIYFPFSMKPLVLLRDWIPDIIDSAVRFQIKPDAEK